MNYLFNHKKIKAGGLVMLALICLISSCKKFVEVPSPPTAITSQNAYDDDASAIATVNSLYADFSATNFPSGLGVTVITGLSSDELQGTTTTLGPENILFFTNNLSNQNGLTGWENYYSRLRGYNTIYEGVSASQKLTPTVKRQLLGECKFNRAFLFFYLVNLYGDVPLALSSDYKTNASLPRSPKADVWKQIISDLKDAQNLLSPDFLDGTLVNKSSERLRPTKWAATALLSRVYLYTGDYQDAEAQATAAINNNGVITFTPDLNEVFLANSSEAIWQLQGVVNNQNTTDGNNFIPIFNGVDYNLPTAYLNTFLINAFELSDNRKSNWVKSVLINGQTYNCAYKYKLGQGSTPGQEYQMVLRLSEQYFIRAEARTQLGTNISGAQADLNIIRSRAGLPNTTATDKTSLLAAIMHERQVELFSEWGNRWLDLKRTGMVDAVMGAGGVCAAKGGTWSSYKQLYPLPQYDLQTDHNLVQNPGY